MEDDGLIYIRQVDCKHEKKQLYTQRRFDILNGFEFTFTRCLDCHKIVGLDARKFSKH
jgi:hypothetical protein